MNACLESEESTVNVRTGLCQDLLNKIDSCVFRLTMYMNPMEFSDCELNRRRFQTNRQPTIYIILAAPEQTDAY